MMQKIIFICICIATSCKQGENINPMHSDVRSFIAPKDTLLFKVDSLHFNTLTSSFDTFTSEEAEIFYTRTLTSDTIMFKVKKELKEEIGSKIIQIGTYIYVKNKMYFHTGNQQELLLTAPFASSTQWFNFSTYFNTNILYKFDLINQSDTILGVKQDHLYSVVKYDIHNRIQEDFEVLIFKPNYGLIVHSIVHLNKDFDTGNITSGYKINRYRNE